MMTDLSNSNVERDSSGEQEDDSIDVRFIVIGSKCRNNRRLQEALEYFGSPTQYSETGLEFIEEAGEYDTIFVLDNFDDENFRQLHKVGARIIGPPAIIKCAESMDRLPCNTRPLYSLTMQNTILCFTGFKIKGELSRLAELVHHMGGGIRKDFSGKITHLVANCTAGQKYRLAVSMDTPVMLDRWVYRCWENRENVGVKATDDFMMYQRISPFYYSVLSFLGFSQEEQTHMEELAVANGGSCAESGSPSSTHLVVAEHNIKQIPFDTHSKLHIVKSEWFWASIQMYACADEAIYRFEEVTEKTPGSHSTTPHTLSGSKTRKRKRLKENLAQLAADPESESPIFGNKRRSGDKALARMSFSASFLDATADTSHTPGRDSLSADAHLSPAPKQPVKNASARQLTTMELYQTERNYVGILSVILETFKAEIENPEQPGGPLLDATEVKRIFGQLPPVYEIHTKIKDELGELISNWNEDASVGEIFVKHADAMIKAYPPFVNYYEDTKETIAACDRAKPRFHAFLKKCQTKPECGRQTLAELFIRPVQRLPSVNLLLKDILKRTDKNNQDSVLLDKAIRGLDEVMTYINEDKRKTERHQLMFDIVNDIDNCPPNLLSSHRTFVCRVDAMELSDSLIGRGEPVSLFLFSDSVEMCNRRVKVLNAKSPAAHGAKTPQKAYKHADLMMLGCIKKVVDITEAGECKNVFALVTRELNKKEKLFAFAAQEEEFDKRAFLDTLTKHICNATCRPDYENLLASLEASTLQIDTSDIIRKPFGSRLKRVSRAFSFNKTPRKLKRAISSVSQVVGSPFRRDSGVFAHPGSALTPRNSNLTAMRLASVNDLSEEFQYSDLIDSVSVTSSPQSKRRETLAGTFFLDF